MKRIVLVLCGVVAAALLVLALVRVSGRSEIPEDLPNVVVIVMCSTRADQTPMYGGVFDTMPSLQSRADAAVVFEDGVTAAPWTRPAVAAIVTGAHPATWGMLEPLARRSDRVLPSGARTLAERLDAVGYETIGRSANPNVSATFGLDQGFDDFANLSPRWRDGVHKVMGSEVVEALVAAVDTRSDPEAPLFVQAMFVDPHQPTTASRVAGRTYRGPGEPMRLGRYRAMLRTLDAAVDRLVTQLSERGITEDNTVFVVVNDHGEGISWPEHHGKGHGRYLYPSTTRLVWMTWGRGVVPGRYPGLVSQVDVLPTLFDYIGLPDADAPDGRSFAPVLRGDLDTPGRTAAYTATMFADTQRGGIVTTDATCLLDFGDGTSQKSEADRGKPVFEPYCARRDGGALEPDAEARLRTDLGAWWSTMTDRLADHGADGVMSPDGTVPADIEAMLQALGYTEGREGVPE